MRSRRLIATLATVGLVLAGPVTAPLPLAGRKHRVVISKTDDMLRMSIDGQSVFSVRDAEYAQIEGELSGPQGLCAGLYTWSDGVAYDDLRAYNLPGPRREVLAEDAQIEYSVARTFADDAVGQPPTAICMSGFASLAGRSWPRLP